MAKKKKQPISHDYISILYSVAVALGFKVSTYTEELLENNLVSNIVTGFNLESDAVRFVAWVDKKGLLSTPQLAAKALLIKLYLETNTEYDMNSYLPKYLIVNHQSEGNTTSIESQANSQNHGKLSNRSNKHIEIMKKQEAVPKIQSFHVSNNHKLIKNRKNSFCPICNTKIKQGRYNIPVYSANGNFRAYYICTLWVCNSCQRYIMSKKEWDNLLVRVTREKEEVRIKANNMRYVGGTRSTRYLYEPITETGVLINRPETKKIAQSYNAFENTFSGMSKTSFLKDAGYSTSLKREERRRILDEQISIHGRRRIAEYLRKFISLHEKRASYENAVSIWQEDLNYISNAVSIKPHR